MVIGCQQFGGWFYHAAAHLIDPGMQHSEPSLQHAALVTRAPASRMCGPGETLEAVRGPKSEGVRQLERLSWAVECSYVRPALRAKSHAAERAIVQRSSCS